MPPSKIRQQNLEVSKPPESFLKLKINNFMYHFKGNFLKIINKFQVFHLLDLTTSTKKGIKFQYRCAKRCGVFLHINSKFNFELFNDPSSTLKIRESSEFKFQPNSFEPDDQNIINIFNLPHKAECQCKETKIGVSETSSKSLIGKDYGFLEDLIRADPLKPTSYFRDLAAKSNKFSPRQR